MWRCARASAGSCPRVRWAARASAWNRPRRASGPRVEHPFQVLKQRFGHRKARYRGLPKNQAQLYTMFALANLVLARRRLQETCV